MNLRDIASVSGKSGLFKVLKPTRTGVILESIDSQKVKMVANANSKVSILKEISIYTTNAEGNVMLEDLFVKINAQHGKEIPITAKASNDEMKAFLGTIVAEFDREKVYPSDIKKIINWYTILATSLPEIFDAVSDNETVNTEDETAKAEASTKPAKASKAVKPAASTTKAKSAKPTPAKAVKTIQSSKRGA